MNDILSNILDAKSKDRRLMALLIDPDSYQNTDFLIDGIHKAEKGGVDFIFFGGSLISKIDSLDILRLVKDISKIPVVLFPSSPMQIDERADGILFLSLISGRNPEYLIGHHVAAAPVLHNSTLEIIPTGYILIGCGKTTSVEYISNTRPIPFNKSNIAVSTALAGEFLGQKLIYMDGGSGAEKPISAAMIEEVANAVSLPIIVGGGIRNVESAHVAYEAGATMIVIGNGAENDPNLITELGELKRQLK